MHTHAKGHPSHSAVSSVEICHREHEARVVHLLKQLKHWDYDDLLSADLTLPRPTEPSATRSK